MPEGHSIHRLARHFERNVVGRAVATSSPQGRFAEGAALLDGRHALAARAVGKQMFLEFEGDLWLRIHLGIYGAWHFAGEVLLEPDDEAAFAAGQDGAEEAALVLAGSAPDAGTSASGAPVLRTRRRVRMSGGTTGLVRDEDESWPPPVVGQVRLRMMTDALCADLRGPSACEVRTTEEIVQVIAKLGPDPLADDSDAAEERFTSVVRRKPTPIGLLLMDQSVVSGIGNIYRAELLFRAGIDPRTPGRDLPEETIRELWRDWARLLRIGVDTGQMMTMDGLDADAYRRAVENREDRHWVYQRAGLPCRACGTAIVLEEMGARKLYRCPTCQS